MTAWHAEVAELASDVLATAVQRPAASPSHETEAYSVAGIPVLCMAILDLAAGIAFLATGGVLKNLALVVIGVLLLPCCDIGFHGLTAVVPGEARVLQLFGAYRGTVRTPGLRWVNPFGGCPSGSAITRRRSPR
jgi:hypothetical protein